MNDDSDDMRIRLRRLLASEAVLQGDFVLSSGRRSSYYVDARLVTLSSAGAALVADAFLTELSSLEVEAVAGLTIGADPIVAAIATLSGLQSRDISGLIVRKEAKAHGAARRIEGPWRSGIRLAVVDDTVTSGASALQAAQTVSEAGGRVLGIFALIDRDEGGRQAIEDAGYSYHPIFSIHELLSTRAEQEATVPSD